MAQNNTEIPTQGRFTDPNATPFTGPNAGLNAQGKPLTNADMQGYMAAHLFNNPGPERADWWNNPHLHRMLTSPESTESAPTLLSLLQGVLGGTNR